MMVGRCKVVAGAFGMRHVQILRKNALVLVPSGNEDDTIAKLIELYLQVFKATPPVEIGRGEEEYLSVAVLPSANDEMIKRFLNLVDPPKVKRTLLERFLGR